MAAGDVHMFSSYVNLTTLASLAAVWSGGDTWKMGIVTNVTVPSTTTADPRWGAGGTTNFATNEVTPGGNYSAGGISITSPGNTLSTTHTNLTATSPISLAANASNPTGAYWGIFYDSTAAGKYCIGYIDLGGSLSLVNGLTINIAGVGSGTQILFQSTVS